MGWTMFFLFVALKVPLIALCLLVWWAIRAVPEDEGAACCAPAAAR